MFPVHPSAGEDEDKEKKPDYTEIIVT